MKGAIFKGIQLYITTQYGDEQWNAIKEESHCHEPFFALGQSYPDELALQILGQASKITGETVEDLLLGIGRFWVVHIGKANYPSIFGLVGGNARQFLLNMNRAHELVTQSLADAQPPRFEYAEPGGGTLRIKYFSRRNLCTLLRGLILGVGDYFDEKLEVTEIGCVSSGAEHCEIEVVFC